ncbi:MAG TPA: flavin reductase family protein [Holophagaceae bacterium]|jgi:flavin reductase (DIM6/NTAB) family NADH-FMN oxidoreductase RutF|nr:flavin reductase family protein [Holophagaceae bacterium]
MHRVMQPKMLYFGTPVVLISTLNEDGSPNLAPMSSAWWLGQSCMLGLSRRSKTAENLMRDGACVLNLPSADMVDVVDRLALTTGRDPVPEYKAKMGYRFERDKFGVAGLSAAPSDLVAPPRVAECPVQLEARIERMHEVGDPEKMLAAFEASILRVHIEERLVMAGTDTHIDPEQWRPLIMSLCEFYGLGVKLHPSRLAEAWGPAKAS